MNGQATLICVCERAISRDFQQDLNKLLVDFGLISLQAEFNRTEDSFSLFSPIELGDLNLEMFNASLMGLAALHRIDIALIPQEVFEAKKKLVVFDMDSTLISAEVIDEMAMKHGVGEKVKLITNRAMNGELNFDQSLTERVSLLKGFRHSQMEEILKDLRFTPGTQEFIRKLKLRGIKTAIASGGFEFFATNIQKQLGIDYVFANDLEFEKDLLTGKIKGSILNAQKKEQIVTELALKEGLDLKQVVAIGDGANDIPMLLKAGLGIAIHAKEKVQKAARYRINFGPMTHALSFMNHETL